MMKKKNSFFYNNGLTIVFIGFMLISLGGQFFFGWKEHNQFLKEHGQPGIGAGSYFLSGHFIQATFENWESEFLQMGLFVIITIFLRQKGSSESKPLENAPCDKEPVPSPRAPWPVKKGGWVLTLYKNSLSIAFISLFIVSFIFHFYGSWIDYNQEEGLKGNGPVSAGIYVTKSKFWFESFQNWQSEFLAVAAIVFFSIYLRQKGSPQSKPVDTPHDENE